MQLRYFILWFFAFVFISISAQSEVEAPDYEKIGKEILDKRGEYYYPALMRRYIANDTTLTISDYRYLYYGFALQEDFNPYRISPYQAKMKSYITSDADINNNCDSIVKYAQLSIDDFPFDTRSMNMLIYAYKCLNRYTEAEMWTIKLKNILDTIITSGDGDTMESPYYVIYPPHEYEIIYRYGLVPESNYMPVPYIDYIQVEKNKFEIEGYYFNIQKSLDAYRLKFE